MLGLYFGNETQFVDHHTLQEHIAPNTTSDLLYKGALADRARSVFSGMIRVHPGAQKTDAYQQNRNLLLSDDARADSIPNLEIGANDVRCSHGATVAPLDEDEIFYLESRSIARPEAPSTSEATEESFTPASCSTLSNRCPSRVRSSICALR